MLGGENVTLGEFYALVGKADRREDPEPALARTAVAKAAGAARRPGRGCAARTPQLTPDLVEIYKHDWAYARRPRSRSSATPRARWPQGLAETVAWLQGERARWGREVKWR